MSREFETLPEAVRQALQAGRPVDAVRLLRQDKGISLKAAHARVQQVVGQGIPGPAGAAAPAMPPRAPGQQGRPGPESQAQSKAGLGLVVTRLLQALRAAEQNRRGQQASPETAALSAEPGGRAPGEQPRTGGVAGWIVVALVALLVALVMRRLE